MTESTFLSGYKMYIEGVYKRHILHTFGLPFFFLKGVKVI